MEEFYFYNVGWDISLGDVDKYVDVINKLSEISSKEYQKKRLDSLTYYKEKININKIIKSYEDLFSL